MRKILIITLFLSSFTLAQAKAGELVDTLFDLFFYEYRFFMVHAENCGIASRYTVKSALLSDLAMTGRVDIATVEQQMDNAYRRELDMGIHTCDPDRLTAETARLEQTHEELVGALLYSR